MADAPANRLKLAGCRPEPLGSYLKGLGVLRVVGIQADPNARGHWDGDEFVLTTSLEQDEVLDFFLDRYRPTPLVAPWNGGSGFGPKDQQSGIAAIESSTSERLAVYRDAIGIGRRLFAEAQERRWAKDTLLRASRAQLPDEVVEWIDATLALGGEGAVYAPLLGTGGNDGRFEFSNNFMQRLVEVMSIRDGRKAPTRERSRAWLHDALQGGSSSGRIEGPVGQFDPGSAGGANSSPLGQAESLVNPWDWVLLLEGSLLFAAAASRRLGSAAPGRAAMPFTFAATRSGYPSSAPKERLRGEVWVPLWGRPATAAELAHLLSEARAEWRGSPARRGIDMVRAAGNLGVDRGIDAFGRFALAERFGRNTLAVSVGRISVRLRPEVSVLAQLDPWVDTVRRGPDPPAAVASAVRRIDHAMYDVSVRGGPQRLQAVLMALADAENAVARSTGFRERARVRPVWGLAAAEWMPKLDDESAELLLAVALASGRDSDGACLRNLLRPVGWNESYRRPDWSEGPEVVPGFGLKPIAAVLAAAHVRRVLVASGLDSGGPDGHSEATSRPGVQTAFRYRRAAPAWAVEAFLAEAIDDGRLARLLGGLMLLDWRSQVGALGTTQPSGPGRPPDPTWGLLAPFFHGRPIRPPEGDPVTLRLEPAWPANLAAGRLEYVLAAALRRLRMARLDPAADRPQALARGAPSPIRLAAALLVPLSTPAVERLLARAVPPLIQKEVSA